MKFDNKQQFINALKEMITNYDAPQQQIDDALEMLNLFNEPPTELCEVCLDITTESKTVLYIEHMVHGIKPKFCPNCGRKLPYDTEPPQNNLG